MRLIVTALLPVWLALPALSAPCGGDFAGFLDTMQTEARASGLPDDSVKYFSSSARQDPAMPKADRSQRVFRKTFLDFSKSLISESRLQNGLAAAQKHDATFDRALAEFGASRGIELAFRAFETDFGAVQGDFNTRDALLTCAHDCRRPDLFQPQVLAAIRLAAASGMDPATTTGAWAGQIGMVQMRPADAWPTVELPDAL